MTTDPHKLLEGEEPPPPGTKAMAVVRWLLLGVAGLFALYAMRLWLPERSQGAGAAQTEASHEHAQGAVYTCPMHHQVHADKPGQCPICGMTLVPVQREGTMKSSTDGGSPAAVEGLASVEAPVERLQLIGVRIDEARSQPLSVALRTVGRVVADEGRFARVHVRFPGYVEKLFVSRQGEAVTKGQPLAAIYSDEVLRLEDELLQSRAKEPQLAAAARKRLGLLGIDAREIARMERLGKADRNIVVRSPASGFVTGLNVIEGDRVEPDRDLFQISNLSRVWVLADVFERDAGRVEAGQPAKLSLDAFPGKPLQGRVEYVYPTLDGNTRTLPVRISFANAAGRLKPGMYGNVEITLPGARGVTIASEAVVDTGDRQYVFVETGPGRFEPRIVLAGARAADDRVEVVRGLSSGDRVAASGNFFLDSESRLRASIAGAPAQPMATESAGSPEMGPSCESAFDKSGAPGKFTECRKCEQVHRGMGSMVADCKNAIAKPWRKP